MNRVVFACLALAFVTPISANAAATPMVGEKGTIGKAAAGVGFPCTDTRDNLHAMIDALVKHDEDGYRDALSNGIALHAGDRVLVIQREGFPFYLDMRIRLLTGDSAHEACWVEADTANLFR